MSEEPQARAIENLIAGCAVHEAGHAVMSWFAAARGHREQRFAHVWIHRTLEAMEADAHYQGAVEHTEMLEPWPGGRPALNAAERRNPGTFARWQQRVETSALTSLAGPMAELRLRENAAEGWADLLIEDQIPRFLQNSRDPSLEGDDLGLRSDMLKVVRLLHDFDNRGAMLLALTRQMGGLLDDEQMWGAVCAVASELMARGRLEFDEVGQIIASYRPTLAASVFPHQ